MSYCSVLRMVVLCLKRYLFSAGRPGTPRTAIIRFSIILCAVCPSLSPLKAATINALSPSYVDVNLAVTLAGRGDTVLFPSGSATWGILTLVLPKGIRLIGAGRDNTFITGDGVLVAIQPDGT